MNEFAAMTAQPVGNPQTCDSLADFRYLAPTRGHMRHLIVKPLEAGRYELQVSDRTPNYWRPQDTAQFDNIEALNAELRARAAALAEDKYFPVAPVEPVEP